jgi:hypothetical protein
VPCPPGPLPLSGIRLSPTVTVGTGKIQGRRVARVIHSSFPRFIEANFETPLALRIAPGLANDSQLVTLLPVEL